MHHLDKIMLFLFPHVTFILNGHYYGRPWENGSNCWFTQGFVRLVCMRRKVTLVLVLAGLLMKMVAACSELSQGRKKTILFYQSADMQLSKT